ncbi:hypothetical protein Ahy_B03g068238 isoform B [Arachis hypogaea]|uniref:Uncharacterized protein n=1 Tax=Arachis hypogaea TaxID=3818 RepID=A0A445A927_ARAHY|nr:hypothetical protein Ahy_B03g068238 isoform B [Arachis hypogaea]
MVLHVRVGDYILMLSVFFVSSEFLKCFGCHLEALVTDLPVKLSSTDYLLRPSSSNKLLHSFGRVRNLESQKNKNASLYIVMLLSIRLMQFLFFFLII